MNRARFDALYREQYPRVLGLCRRMLGSVSDPEDAAQEVFMRGFRALARYRTDQPFGAWIGAIATNYCIDLLRRRQRWGRLFSDEPAQVEKFADPTKHGVAPLIDSHEADVVSRAVDALPEKLRVPLVLAYYADATYDEIAATLGITRNYVGVLLMRARERLRAALPEFESESESEVERKRGDHR